jgi:hypothetical protein
VAETCEQLLWDVNKADPNVAASTYELGMNEYNATAESTTYFLSMVVTPTEPTRSGYKSLNLLSIDSILRSFLKFLF